MRVKCFSVDHDSEIAADHIEHKLNLLLSDGWRLRDTWLVPGPGEYGTARAFFLLERD